MSDADQLFAALWASVIAEGEGFISQLAEVAGLPAASVSRSPSALLQSPGAGERRSSELPARPPARLSPSPARRASPPSAGRVSRRSAAMRNSAARPAWMSLEQAAEQEKAPPPGLMRGGRGEASNSCSLSAAILQQTAERRERQQSSSTCNMGNKNSRTRAAGVQDEPMTPPPSQAVDDSHSYVPSVQQQGGLQAPIYYAPPHISVPAMNVLPDPALTNLDPGIRSPLLAPVGYQRPPHECRRACSCSSSLSSGRHSRRRVAGGSQRRSHHRSRESGRSQRSARSRSTRCHSHSSSGEDSCSSDGSDRRERHRGRDIVDRGALTGGRDIADRGDLKDGPRPGPLAGSARPAR